MAHHDFGILAAHEEQSNLFFEYTPKRFHCISIDMDIIDDCGLLWDALNIPTDFQRISHPAHGLGETGITLILPDSLPQFRDVAARHGLTELALLSEKAMQRGCFVIHFGI